MTAALAERQTTVGDLPGSERLVVVVVADSDVQKDHSGAGAIVGGVIGAIIGGPLGAAIGAGVGAAAGAAGSPSTQKGVVRVRRSEAIAQLQFPPGHPIPGESYGRHPLFDRRYVPLGTLHAMLREEKTAELMHLLVSLGATRLRGRMLHADEASAHASMGINVAGLERSASAQGSKSAFHGVQFDESYRPRHAPHVPSDLAWLPHEPSWQGIVTRRMRYGTNQLSARIEYKKDFGFNAELATKVEQFGGHIAGGFKTMEHLIWEIDVEFGSVCDIGVDAEARLLPEKGAASSRRPLLILSVLLVIALASSVLWTFSH